MIVCSIQGYFVCFTLSHETTLNLRPEPVNTNVGLGFLHGECVTFLPKGGGCCLSRLLSPHPAGTWQDSCFIHQTDKGSRRLGSLVLYPCDCLVTEVLGTDSWLWLKHDERVCVIEVPLSLSE